MKKLHEMLSTYLTEHPADMGMSDAESILAFLYTAYWDEICQGGFLQK